MTTVTDLPAGWRELGDGWTLVEVRDDRNYCRAYDSAPDFYRRSIIQGKHSLDGSTITGQRKWASNFSRRRAELLQQMIERGVTWSQQQFRGRLVLCLGNWPLDEQGNPKVSPRAPSPDRVPLRVATVADLFL